jgi:hypothetical protein
MVVINHRNRALRSSDSHAQESPDPVRAPQAGRRGRFLLVITGLVVVAGMVAACGTAAAPGTKTSHNSGTKSTSGTSGTSENAKISLNVKIINGKGARLRHWTLQCEPAGGTSPDPAAACRALLGVRRPFAPVSKFKMCPMILASSEQIEITGTWFGQKVNRVIVDGGCDVGMFDSLKRTFY